MTEPTTSPFKQGVKQRDIVQMSAEEIDEFLHERHNMSLATVNHDGTIHLVAMWYGFLDGCIAIETKTKSQKIQNLRRNPQITCLVEDGQSYEELRGVEMVGRAEFVDDQDKLFELGVSVYERYVGGPYTEEQRPMVEAMLNKRSVVKIHIERWVSWDHRKLAIAG